MPISCYSTKSVLELMMASIMIISIGLIFYRSILDRKSTTRKTLKDGTIEEITGKSRGVGARTIQFVAVCLIIPAIVILGLEKILQSETVATIIGGMVGFVLSGISNYDNKLKD